MRFIAENTQTLLRTKGAVTRVFAQCLGAALLMYSRAAKPEATRWPPSRRISKKDGIIVVTPVGLSTTATSGSPVGPTTPLMSGPSVGPFYTLMSEASLHVLRKLTVRALIYLSSVQWFALLLDASAAQDSSSHDSHGASGNRIKIGLAAQIIGLGQSK
jgi:hypothetical protein